MVRWLWQNRLTRSVQLFVRWLLVWLAYLLGHLGRRLQVSKRVLSIMLRPRNPNNLFVAGSEASYQAAEAGQYNAMADLSGGERPALLWSEQAAPRAAPTSVSLWRGERETAPEEAKPGALVANRRYAYLDLLSSKLKRLKPEEMKLLDELITRLARKWLDIDETFEQYQRRNRLDVGRTLRYNIPRYAGRILSFKWATKERPLPQQSKPARILVIGDVSHSMVHYVAVVLYFFHSLNFRFVVESFIFSEQPTYSTPYLNGLGTFPEKMQRLLAGAKSWNAGTRLGSALVEIAESTTVDEYTHVIIATDGKVSLQKGEQEKIERYMGDLRQRAKQVIFLTPSAEFAAGTRSAKPEKVGALKYEFTEIPIFLMGPPLWYGTLSQYADRLYLVQTVQDLVDMTEDLIVASRDH